MQNKYLYYEFDKAIKLWKERLEIIKNEGKITTGHGSHGSDFFQDGRSYQWSKEDKIAYCENKIEQIEKDKNNFLNLNK